MVSVTPATLPSPVHVNIFCSDFGSNNADAGGLHRRRSRNRRTMKSIFAHTPGRGNAIRPWRRKRRQRVRQAIQIISFRIPQLTSPLCLPRVNPLLTRHPFFEAPFVYPSDAQKGRARTRLSTPLSYFYPPSTLICTFRRALWVAVVKGTSPQTTSSLPRPQLTLHLSFLDVRRRRPR